MLKIIEAEFGSEIYLLTVDLRRRILRLPLGLDFTEQELAAEHNDIHLAALQNNELVGCVVLTQEIAQQIKDTLILRQMATAPEVQKSGIGREIISRAEQIALQRGYKQIRLHARETAIGFYEKLGYSISSELFIEVTIPHREMLKQLPQQITPPCPA